MAQTSSGKMILITGATGRQGGAVLRHLIGSKFKLRALTCDPGRDVAWRITAAGAELMQGDLNGAGSLRKAIAGTYGVNSLRARPAWVASSR